MGETRLLSRRVRAALYVAVLGALGLLAWLVGWSGYNLLNPRAARSPEETPAPTALPTDPPATTVPAPPAGTPAPARMPRPTSTSAPTYTPSPTSIVITVQEGEGMYRVCRRHCPARWPGDAIPPDLDAYARQVTYHNGLVWPDPVLHKGQQLDMLSCPQ